MKYIKTIQNLLKNKEVSFSSVPISFRDELIDEGLVKVKVISANKKKLIITDEFKEIYQNINKVQNATTRADLTKLNTHTKIKKISPQEGLYLNGKCKILDIDLPLTNMSALFLKELPKIDKNILVICVENFENLIYAQYQFEYFRDDNILFVYRNSAMLKFIQNLPNQIIYFGDFDLEGINIYLNSILPKNKNITFFIPQDIEKLIIKYGSKELYQKQLNHMKNLTSLDKDIQNLIDIINKEQKSLEQEYFINVKYSNSYNK